jgi:phosphotransferase system  glucose/maltose/N-acetylglucosamine-specific IIC component
MARATFLSALIYTSVALAASGLFLAVTVLAGDYGWVARVGGAGWVFFLSMIILMPVVIPWMKQRLKG